MAIVELATLTAPVSDGEPCGPDLDLAGDADFMNFLARAEGLLPASFFDSDGKPFDRSSIDFEAEVQNIKPLLAKTHDLRLLVLLAKLMILGRDLDSFATCVSAVATLLRDHWDDVHPRGEDGDYSLRMAALASLDDLPPVILPLQYMPLAEHRRHGPISYRSQMMVSGEARPREGEEVVDAAAIEQALRDLELPQLIARRDAFQALHDALAEIRNVSTERAGYEQAVTLERLPPLADRILAFLDGAVAKRDPSAARMTTAPGEARGGADAARPAAEAGSAPTGGAVVSNADAAGALAAVADYFSRREPSNPALLLVRQAEQLIGKSFLDVMRILVPAHVDQAVLHVGGDHTFELPIARLAEFASATEEWPAANGSTTDSDGWGQSGDGEGAPDDGEPTGDGGWGSAAESHGDDGSRSPESDTSAEPRFQAATRQQAVILLDQVASYYRAVEPSSPIPYLTDRARGLADRDFLSILKDLLPESALRSLRDES